MRMSRLHSDELRALAAGGVCFLHWMSGNRINLGAGKPVRIVSTRKKESMMFLSQNGGTSVEAEEAPWRARWRWGQHNDRTMKVGVSRWLFSTRSSHFFIWSLPTPSFNSIHSPFAVHDLQCSPSTTNPREPYVS
ncbi:hypothetical protein K437DRAFT_20221 [Tilletiaria anomala UBC 951]|uniref:Uncharacterized protein n=1 Tax=Tilletiaria anomala (strain ATCC 24038 / CBS 436.72 / UBC 951) TaxID=1037660 RepID=A0A066VAL4_TILAU|nr:uncharacterized protein K437DRAFT_20221 [Tilletiaria anomala UBC 951]KDN38782.1 hypothetical protein K437DRAFT_20221 [Tilletiaria anomala UBC 951]